MKRLLPVAALLIASFDVAPCVAASTFGNFWRQFRPAAARGDLAAVARLTRLPFQFKTTITDSGGLRPALGQLFDGRTRACFAKARPVKDGSYYSVTCSGRQFGFDANEGSFQFSGVQPNE